jgi:hypothetical protein
MQIQGGLGIYDNLHLPQYRDPDPGIDVSRAIIIFHGGIPGQSEGTSLNADGTKRSPFTFSLRHVQSLPRYTQYTMNDPASMIAIDMICGIIDVENVIVMNDVSTSTISPIETIADRAGSTSGTIDRRATTIQQITNLKAPMTGSIHPVLISPRLVARHGLTIL